MPFFHFDSTVFTTTLYEHPHVFLCAFSFLMLLWAHTQTS